jgi:hypothetical protein
VIPIKVEVAGGYTLGNSGLIRNYLICIFESNIIGLDTSNCVCNCSETVTYKIKISGIFGLGGRCGYGGIISIYTNTSILIPFDRAMTKHISYIFYLNNRKLLYRLYESYIELWGAIFNNLLDSYKKNIEKLQDEYRFAFLIGYSDGYKAGLAEITS